MTSPLILFLLLFNVKFRWILQQKLISCFKELKPSRNSILFYGASIGEAEIGLKLAAPLAKELKLDFVFFSNTQAGLRNIRQKSLDFPNSQSAIMPFDFSWFNNYILDKLQPKLIVIMESEFWANFLLTAKSRNIPVVSLNSRLSHGSKKLFKALMPIMNEALGSISRFYCSSPNTVQNLLEFNVPLTKIHKVVSFKFSRFHVAPAKQIAAERAKLANLEKFIFVAGSIQTSELNIILAAWRRFQQSYPKSSIVIIPRHPEQLDKAIKTITQHKFKLLTAKNEYYQFDSGLNFIPKFGILKLWYQCCDCSFVGGSLVKRGGQNFIEPLLLKKPVATGPKVKNFDVEKELLVQRKALRIVCSAEELVDFLTDCHNQTTVLFKQTDLGYDFVNQNLIDFDKLAKSISKLANKSKN